MAKSEMPNKIEATSSRSELYREIVPSYFVGGIRPGFIETIAVTVRSNLVESAVLGKPQKVEHIEEVCIKLTPMEAKNLNEWLINTISEYEKQFGDIIIAKE
jgi:hypothetical protein